MQTPPHIHTTFVIAGPVGPIHLFADIGGHRLIEISLGRRERITRRVGAALGEQRRAIKSIEFLFGEATHHVGYVRLVNAFAEPPFETITVEQPHKELEIGFLAVVRCRRHQQEIAGSCPEQFAEFVSLGLFDFAAEI
jgi:hypothetical protein